MNGDSHREAGDSDKEADVKAVRNPNPSSEASGGLEKVAREMEQRQFLQFQEKMLKKDAQMVELDQVFIAAFFIEKVLKNKSQSKNLIITRLGW